MGIAKTRTRFRTVGDLIRGLGVPAHRIRMAPLPGTATQRDLIRTNDHKESGLCELVHGTLVEKPMGFREGLLAAIIIELIGPFVRTRKLGFLVGADSPMRLRRGLIRLPDMAFVSWKQLPDLEVPDDAVPDLFPDLAVEIYSQSNTRKEMTRKRREYFRAGCRLVWIVFPKTQTIDVYTSPTEFETLGIGDVLDGGKVLPGLKIPVRKIFSPPPVPERGNKQANGNKR
jgi:Uma2 family endonuclease